MDTLKVLLLDDEPLIINLLMRILSKDPRYEVDSATRGYDAINLAVANSYGAMICDIQLPDLDGPDVVKEMRQRRCGPKMVIFISGAVKAAPRNEGSDTFFIRKPFNPSEILTLLNRCR